MSSELIADQLRPLARALRERQSTVRLVSQILLEIGAASEEAAFTASRGHVLRWIARRAGRPLPSVAYSGQSFEQDEIGSQYVAAVALPNDEYWACRIDDADKDVPQRTWTTEIGIGRHQDRVLLGARLQCVTRGEDVLFIPSVPGFVRQIVEDPGLRSFLDDIPIATDPWIVDNESRVENLVEFLEKPARRHDVVVFSLPDDATDTNDSLLDISQFARRTLGTAHPIVLTGPASWMLTERVGREFSVFNGAVRTYRPGLALDTSQPMDHPIAMAERIATWSGDGPGAFLDFLAAQTLRPTVTARDVERELPSFASVRRIVEELRRQISRDQGATDEELLGLALEENDRLRKDLRAQEDELWGELSVAHAEAERAKRAEEEALRQASNLRARIHYLQQAASKGELPLAELPTTFEPLDSWARENLAGSIVIHNRALRAAKKAEFENVRYAYEVLLMLRDLYVPMRREGGRDCMRAYQEKLKEMRLEDVPCFSGPRAAEEGEAYFVDYAGARCELNMHLKGSSSRDPRLGFRLYYFWDDKTSQLVVGHLPTHLPTRLT